MGTPPRRTTDPGEPAPDRWQTIFFRLVQVVGLLLIVWEARPGAPEREWLLLIALGMLFGSLGVELVLRGLLKILGR